MATAKSFAELGSIYAQSVLKESTAPAAQQGEELVTEGKALTPEQIAKQAKPANASAKGGEKSKQTVGKVNDIGTPKLTKQGGDENVKKDLDKPKEGKTEDGKPVDGEKAISQKKTVTESKSTMKQSLFDQVYKQIVENSDELDETPVTPEGGEGEASPAGEAAPAPEGEQEEAFDPVAAVKELCTIVTALKQHFGIADDEEVVEVPADDIPPVGEAVDAKELPDSAGKSLQGKKNDVGGVKVVHKKADSKVTTGDGKLEKAPDGEKLAGNKEAGKVKGTGPDVKGGNASAFES
jgi:hypothetical protein